MTYDEAGVLLEKGHAAGQLGEPEVFLEQLEEGRPRLVGETIHKVTDLISSHLHIDDVTQLRLERGLDKDK